MRYPSPTPPPLGDRPAAIRLGFAAEPVVDLIHLGTNTLYHECLARIMLAESIVLKAGDFVDDLEGGGSIRLLDAAMVDLVLDALDAQRHARLGCNISPRTLADRFALADILRRIGVRPWLASRLTLEITESAPLREIADVGVRLGALRSLGCHIALDDFGARFATPTHLRGVAIEWDIVKLDRTCFGDLQSLPQAHDRLRSAIARASSLASVVVVEGIETREHLDVAREAGAHYGQGWVFEGPVREYWTVPDETIGTKLATAMIAHGAALRPSGSGSQIVSDDSECEADSPMLAEQSYVLSRVDTFYDRVRTLIASTRAGGTA